jgi:hypothetical protein
MSKLITAFFFVAFLAFMGVVMVEWASGCGETWIDASGTQHVGECWIIR